MLMSLRDIEDGDISDEMRTAGNNILLYIYMKKQSVLLSLTRYCVMYVT